MSNTLVIIKTIAFIIGIGLIITSLVKLVDYTLVITAGPFAPLFAVYAWVFALRLGIGCIAGALKEVR